MKMIISREYLPEETKGALFVVKGANKLLELISLELAWRDNQRNISCIPEGVYACRKVIRPNGDHAISVTNVKDRTFILMHIANFAAGKKIDLEGCIAPGMYFDDINGDGYIDSAQSTQAMNILMEILPNKFELHII